jgi:hypothetical protein
MQQIECVEHDRVIGVSTPVLECLERGSALVIDRDDLTVDDDLRSLQAPSGCSDRRIHGHQILIVPGADVDRGAIFNDQRAIAILLPTLSFISSGVDSASARVGSWKVPQERGRALRLLFASEVFALNGISYSGFPLR